MKKLALTALLLATSTFGISAMANEITCTGHKTKASIVLGLTGSAFPLNKSVYSFKDKVIPTLGFEFAIHSDKDQPSQMLRYKFKTLKRHPLAKKGSTLVLLIKQPVQEVDPYIFKLNEKHEAELSLEVDGAVTLIDKMDCK